MSNDKSMERLSKIDKLLRQFPKGIRAAQIAEKIEVKRQTVYDDLNSLKLQKKATNKEGLWFPAKQKRDFGFFAWLDRRAERQRKQQLQIRKENLLRAIHYKELLADTYPEASIYKKIAEQDRETLKKLEEES